MTTRLTPYGSAEQAHNIAKVGKSKTPSSLASRMPSPELAAKVGIVISGGVPMRRVTRRNAQG